MASLGRISQPLERNASGLPMAPRKVESVIGNTRIVKEILPYFSVACFASADLIAEAELRSPDLNHASFSAAFVCRNADAVNY